MRYLIKICYDGANYSGWQKQPNAKTIQETLEKAMSEVSDVEVELNASGRTDAGVSALCQCAHFDCDKRLDSKILGHINHLLPSEIRVYSIKEVGDNFHARYDVKCKTYEYKFYLSKINLPIYDKFATQIKEKIDIDVFEINMKMLLGSHDFTAFCASNSMVEDKVRTIHNVELKQDGGLFTFKITGNGFLYNMVRIIIGTLIDIASGKIKKNISEIINQKQRENAGKTLSAKGLMLYDVCY